MVSRSMVLVRRVHSTGLLILGRLEELRLDRAGLFVGMRPCQYLNRQARHRSAILAA